MFIIMHMSIAKPHLPLDLDELAEQWLSGRHLSGATQRAYRLELSRFIRWTSSVGLAMGELRLEHLGAFGRCLASERPSDLTRVGVSRPLLRSSIVQARRIVSAWMRWAAANSWLHPSVAGPLNWPGDARMGESQSNLRAGPLQAALKAERPTTADGARASFVSALAFWLGLGPAEIADLRRGDVRVGKCGVEVRVPTPDGKRWIPAPSSLHKAWQSYDAVRPPGGTHAVGSQRVTDSPLSTATIARIIREGAGESARARSAAKLNARRLRAAFINLAISRGWSTDDLAAHLRRQSIRRARPVKRSESEWRRLVEAIDRSL